MSDSFNELFDEVYSRLIEYFRLNTNINNIEPSFSLLIEDIRTYFEPYDVDVNIDIDEEDKYTLNIEVKFKGIL